MLTLNTAKSSGSHKDSLRKLALQGFTVLGVFAASVGVWAARVPLDGAVVTTGQLVVNSSVRKIQHPTGGVVGELLVREGDQVRAGDVLIRLDETVIRATLTAIEKKIDELQARAARLEAERLGYGALKFPKVLRDRISDPDVAEILSTEQSLYEARKLSHVSKKQRLGERVGQLTNELRSLQTDLETKRRLADITEKELANLRALDARQLVQTQRLNAVERDAVAVAGQQAQLQSAMAQAEGKITETEMQLAAVDDELRAEVTKELRETQADLAQQHEKRVAALDQLHRVEIRAPIAGQVHQLAAHTIGGVVQAAEPIMLIVPSDEALELEVRIQPHDIDQLHVAQEASIRIQAFNRRTTPEIEGEVTRISADVTKDQQTGAFYYTARVALKPEGMAKLAGLKLQAGMQAEAYIKTAERTAFEYLTKPISDQMRRALRER